MLNMYIVIKKLHRAAVANDETFDFFATHINKKLLVRTMDFDTTGPWTEHGIFSIVVNEGIAVRMLFMYRNDTDVEFELYLGGEKIWPKQ